MNFEFKTIEKANITDNDRKIFGNLLKLQNKVFPDKNGRFDKKADRCLLICIVYNDEKPIAIGGIIRATEFDFLPRCANLPEKAELFDWELGYIYTLPNFRGQKIGSKMVDLIMEKYGNKNLMASTELNPKNNMQKILLNKGFKQCGETWKSKHNLDLGLFLKFKNL